VLGKAVAGGGGNIVWRFFSDGYKVELAVATFCRVAMLPSLVPNQWSYRNDRSSNDWNIFEGRFTRMHLRLFCSWKGDLARSTNQCDMSLPWYFGHVARAGRRLFAVSWPCVTIGKRRSQTASRSPRARHQFNSHRRQYWKSSLSHDVDSNRRPLIFSDDRHAICLSRRNGKLHPAKRGACSPSGGAIYRVEF
jgi:hypothetical protein